MAEAKAANDRAERAARRKDQLRALEDELGERVSGRDRELDKARRMATRAMAIAEAAAEDGAAGDAKLSRPTAGAPDAERRAMEEIAAIGNETDARLLELEARLRAGGGGEDHRRRRGRR